MSLQSCNEAVESHGFRLQTELHSGCWTARILRTTGGDDPVVEATAATEAEAAYTALVELEALLASTGRLLRDS